MAQRDTEAEMLASGHSWKELKRTAKSRCAGGLFSMVYSAHEAKGLRKQGVKVKEREVLRGFWNLIY